MNTPTLIEFDSWKNSPIGVWYFREYLQGFADAMARENGRNIGGFEDSESKAFMTSVKNAGVIKGVDDVINGITEEDDLLDPFAEERNDDETHLDRQEPDS